MAFHPFEVNTVHLAYTLLGAFVVLFSLCSLRASISYNNIAKNLSPAAPGLTCLVVIKEKLYIGEAPIAVVTGIIIGPYVLGLFDPRGWGGGSEETGNEITLEVTRVVIAISVFAVGVELPKVRQKPCSFFNRFALAFQQLS